jgi:nitroreductase
MDLLTAIHTRRTVHKWIDRPVEEAVLDEVLAAAHQAPCHRLTWPWRFIVVGQETRESLLPTAVQLAAAKAGMAPNEKIMGAVRTKILSAGGLIVVVLRRDDDDFRDRENYAATSCAIQNMLLVAVSNGLGSKWSTGKLTRHAQTAALLGVDPSIEEVVGFVWLGYPQRIPEVERPPLSEHIQRLP